MGWSNSGDLKTIMLEGVIPLVLGTSLCFLSVLYCLGILQFHCCRQKREVVPVALTTAGRNDTTQPSIDQPMTQRAAEQAFGPVACQASLYGMQAKERIAVLESVFEPLCSVHKENDKSKKQKGPRTTGTPDESHHSYLDMLDTRCSCAICLRAYEDGEEVMTGSQCSHMFHKNCAMVWLTHYKRPKDHCPYCRNEMLTPTEMKTAALEILGEQRVQELSHRPFANNNNNNNNNSNTTNARNNNNEAGTEPMDVPGDIESGISLEMHS